MVENKNKKMETYYCRKCNMLFEAMDFQAFRLATGGFIRHGCGETACIASGIKVPSSATTEVA